jgi:D-glycero-D-manno-heptose 1,7-bisphosphate phosphatase
MIDGIPHPPPSEADTHIMPGIRDVLAMAMKMGYLVIVITNQPDYAKGIQTKEEIENINDYLLNELPIDRIYTCWHKTEDNCLCKKPKIGLFLEAQKDYNIDFNKSFMVGDRSVDIEAGNRVGCTTIFLNNIYETYENNILSFDYIIDSVEEIKKIIEENL